jgi:hypothetical protein
VQAACMLLLQLNSWTKQLQVRCSRKHNGEPEATAATRSPPAQR